jgi:PAS fold
VDELSSRHREAEQSFTQQLQDKNETLSSLERRRRFNEMLLNAISAGLIATDKELRVVFINRAAQGVLQISLADCLERPLLEIFGGSEDIARELHDLTEQRWTEFDLVSAGGVLLHIGLTIMPAPEEFADDLGVVVLFRDLGAVQADEQAYSPSQEPMSEGPEEAPLSALELVRVAAEEAGFDTRPVIDEPAGVIPPVWVDVATALDVLRELVTLSAEVAGAPENVAIGLEPGVPLDMLGGPAVSVDFRLASGKDANTLPRPDGFQERLEEAAATLHAMAGALLVSGEAGSSLIMSALLPAVGPDPGPEPS